MSDTRTKKVFSLNIEVESITFSNKENGWSVLRVKKTDDESVFYAVGTIGSVCSGENLKITGSWQNHPSFGRQFIIEHASYTRPSSHNGLVKYLSSDLFKGIGPKTANKIVEHFGQKTVEILDNSPQKIKTIDGLNKRSANKLIKSWEKERKKNETLLFLSDLGITILSAKKIASRFGSQTIEIISNNPYQLIAEIRGYSFKKVDNIAASLGITSEHPQRIQEAILFLLRSSEDSGHTYLLQKQLEEKLREQLDISNKELIYAGLEKLEELKEIISFSMDEDNTCISLSKTYEDEKIVFDSIKRIMSINIKKESEERLKQRIINWTDKFCKSASLVLSDDQRQAVLKCALSKVFILTGGPGVGKTTTAKAIIHLFRAMGRQISLAAPTGRAAQKMTEVSHIEAKTIHRLLEWDPINASFTRNDTNRLVAQVFIIDEVSMLDVHLARSLFQAIPSSAQLILIGDHDQLPPIGAGNVLYDLIASKKTPHIKLEQIFRQAQDSNIIKVAHDINQGIISSFDKNKVSDCHFITCKSDQEIINTITKLLTHDLKSSGYSPFSDTQILSPMNKGILGCQNLNPLCQNILNPKKTPEKNNLNIIRDGDKVIQTTNNYDLLVFNGDIGVVEHANMEDNKLAIRFQGRLVVYDEESAKDIRLAYAITVHKSQGSEFPVVIIPLSMSHFIMLRKNLIYTALTRGKKLVILIGSEKAFAYSIKNQKGLKRQTQLMSLIKSNLNKAD